MARKSAMKREYYSDTISKFLNTSLNEILGILTQSHQFPLEQPQKEAWLEEIEILKPVISGYKGTIWFEYSIPRMGKRIDVVLLIGAVIFILEFKIGEKEFHSYAVDQVWDYALDLKNFHETSRDHYIAPVLIATQARQQSCVTDISLQHDRILNPIRTNTSGLSAVLEKVLNFAKGDSIDSGSWAKGRYCPTPTIVEAARALYNGHDVKEISRSDASAINLSQTSDAIEQIIKQSKQKSQKSICFVTGVPGAGKTLVGLNTATTHFDKKSNLYSVFLSGNGPLVRVLCEALAQDKVARSKDNGKKIRKSEAMSEVKAFVQNIHHFRDECLVDYLSPPIEHVALFDEAQRAWNLAQTSNFMRRKKNRHGFNQSEPEFLISCLDRHKDWAVIVCLVGGGQEINTGEAGIKEWIDILNRRYHDWHIYVSPRLTDSEYGAGEVLEQLRNRKNVTYKKELHLSVSMRSFRAENVSLLVKQILDLDTDQARKTLKEITAKYEIALTRDLSKAKEWLRSKARGSERYGIVVSSAAERLKPHAIDVKSPMDPVHWFLKGKEDVRSSYYLEDVATEFDVQGLELDWTCVTWDADFRYTGDAWQHWSFCGDRWNQVKKEERRNYQKNAYRVLLTRARQGMVIVVPPGDKADATRNPAFYDPTFEYLHDIGFSTI